MRFVARLESIAFQLCWWPWNFTALVLFSHVLQFNYVSIYMRGGHATCERFNTGPIVNDHFPDNLGNNILTICHTTIYIHIYIYLHICIYIYICVCGYVYDYVYDYDREREREMDMIEYVYVLFQIHM